MLLCFALVCLPLLAAALKEDRLTNVALNKVATQSSDYYMFAQPETLTDGNLATSMPNCTHTGKEAPGADRWLRVDLGARHKVFSVVLTTRAECCENRTADFDIIVSRKLPDPAVGRPVGSTLCVHQGPALARNVTVELTCAKPIKGRYVTLVRSDYDGVLNLCELQVIGIPKK